ncbi:MAG TPA: hypothetical protein VNT75_23200, partial [Symbiobacteriaceae bacterium]|nr:hypothetical protein [Symbiobacteriaceae bacterium]
GLAALLLQATGAEPLLIKDALKRTAQDLGNGPNQSGAGFVRPQAALEYLRRSTSLIQQEVYPGESAVYSIALTNRGNANDRFRVTHWFGENGLRYKSQSTLPGRSLRSIANTAIRSGESIDARAEIRIDESWAGVEDTVYTFFIQATSMADRKATDTDRATLKVKATKRSMAEYTRLETADLREEVAAAATDRTTKSELLTRTDRLTAAEQSAVAALAEHDEAGGNAHLEAAADIAADMAAYIRARQAAGAIEPDAAQSLIGRLAEIRSHLGLSATTAMR